MSAPEKQENERRHVAEKDERTGKWKVKSVATVRANLTIAEKDYVEEQALRAGISVAEYTRLRILRHRVSKRPQKSRKDRPAPAPSSLKHNHALVSELNAIGVNLNQLSKHANAGRMQPDSIEATLEELRATLTKVLADGS